MTFEPIPFNRAYRTGRELRNVEEAQAAGHLSGDGRFTKLCHEWIERKTGTRKALLTHSCTSALDMAALLLNLEAGDEIIMPSFTFVSTANAFVLRGAVPVFVDIREDTLNLDEKLVEAAITPRTRAIVPVHYAGVSCDMDAICEIADRHGLKIIEDAAQGVMAAYRNRSLGAIGHLGTFSFHGTKNISCGEGGGLLVNDPAYALRAEVLREKGTNRTEFVRGEVDKYTWHDVGSSFLPSEITAAYLCAQFEEAERITSERRAIWQRYHDMLDPLERRGLLRRPTVPTECEHNGHLYYILLTPDIARQSVLDHLKRNGIGAAFHYVPLHSSPAGKRFGRANGELHKTNDLSERLIRLPLWNGLSLVQQGRVVDILRGAFESLEGYRG